MFLGKPHGCKPRHRKVGFGSFAVIRRSSGQRTRRQSVTETPPQIPALNQRMEAGADMLDLASFKRKKCSNQQPGMEIQESRSRRASPAGR